MEFDLKRKADVGMALMASLSLNLKSIPNLYAIRTQTASTRHLLPSPGVAAAEELQLT